MKPLHSPRFWILILALVASIGIAYEAAQFGSSTKPSIIHASTQPQPAHVRPTTVPSHDGPIIDLDADKGVEATDDGKVNSWKSQVDWISPNFHAVRDDGHPMLRKNIQAINGHNTLIFDKKELLNDDADAFAQLITGNGYTWFAVLTVHKQITMEPDVDVIFGNLKSGGNFEGFWAGVTDNNKIWCGSRNSTTFGRWDSNNPHVLGPKLEENQFYVTAGRMGSGGGTVNIELFVNDSAKPVASLPFPVNPNAHSEKMEIGQEREMQIGHKVGFHPGRESFMGEIARITFWDRPLSDEEMAKRFEEMKKMYGVK